MRRFDKINIEISNICNLQCSFCPEVIRAKELMPVELFERIITQVAPLTEQVCFHLMGEPLVHPRLADFLDICGRRGVPVFFVTNGVLLREKQAELLLHPTIRQVCFSLHSFQDNFGDRDPSQYLERIFHFTEAAFEKRPELYINYRLWNLKDPRGSRPGNQDLLDRIRIRLEGAAPWRLAETPVDVRMSKSRRVKNRLYLHFDTEFTWPSLELPVLGTRGTCYGLSKHFGILVDGTVVPCCLDKEAAIPLGNLREQEIGPILESTRARAIFEGFQNGRLVEDLCQRCQYIERFQR